MSFIQNAPQNYTCIQRDSVHDPEREPLTLNLAVYEVVYLVARVLVHLRVLLVFQIIAAAYPLYLASMVAVVQVFHMETNFIDTG